MKDLYGPNLNDWRLIRFFPNCSTLGFISVAISEARSAARPCLLSYSPLWTVSSHHPREAAESSLTDLSAHDRTVSKVLQMQKV